MAKDNRLYARISLDFAENPKIETLSDAGFRTLIEMVLYSRRLLTDGFIREDVAAKRWSSEVLSELLSNDQTNPSIARAENGYQIHDFLTHQDSREEVEQRRSRNSAAGRAGGIAKASKSLSETPSESLSNSFGENVAETETETETVLSKERTTPRSARGTRVPSNFTITEEMREWAAVDVPHVDVDKKLAEWVDYWKGVPGKNGVKIDWLATWKNGMRKQEEFALRDLSRNPSAAPVKRRQFRAGAA
jgi:hypothetical protein